MKKLKYTLLLGVIFSFVAINVVKPNAGLDLNTLFKMVDQANNKIDNYIQKNNFSVTVSKIDPKLDEANEVKNETFSEIFKNILLNKKEKEKTEEEKNRLKSLQKQALISNYSNIQRYELFYKDNGFEKRYATDYVARDDKPIQSFYIEENGKIKSSLNNEIVITDDKDYVQKLSPLTESDNFIHIFDYKKITDELKEISNFVGYNEIDKFYVFLKEYDDIKNDEVKELFTKLEIDKDIERYKDLTIEDIFNGNWDNTHALINYNLDSTDMGIKKIIFSITLEKDGIRTSIHSFKEFEQFNILNDILLPKQLRESR